VNGNNPIPDASMTASSDLGLGWKPFNARLHGSTAWCASAAERGTVPPNFYIQVSRVEIYNYKKTITKVVERFVRSLLQ